jgi:F0F1-type ATP synthase assembly protein I
MLCPVRLNMVKLCMVGFGAAIVTVSRAEGKVSMSLT